MRYAPSPTGALHLGGLRTALFNYLFARRHGGDFLLRIEDTDRARTVPGAVDGIQRALVWAGIEPDEGPSRGGPVGPYSQSERLHLYAAAAEELIKRGAAYRCFCSAERLASVRAAAAAAGRPDAPYDGACAHVAPEAAAARAAAGESNVVRLRVPPGETRVRDVVLGTVVFAHAVVDDAVLLKSDGWPTYHLASVVDDAAMRITHVIRGQEWLASTPKHVLTYAALGLKPPVWVHLPLLLNPDRSKLSKRAGAAGVDDFRSAGFTPEALVDFCATLGWTPPAPAPGTLHSLDSLAAAFDLSALHKSGAVVDRSRLEAVANDHLKATVVQALTKVAPAALRPATPSSGPLAPPVLREGSLPGRVLDTPGLATLRARVAPFLPSEMLERTETERLNAILVAQHERVGSLSGFAPLVIPFLLHGSTDAYIQYLKSAPAVATRDRIAKSVSRGGSTDAPSTVLFTPTLAAAARKIRACWAAMECTDFSSGSAAAAAIKAAAVESSLPIGRIMLPMRWALTGLDMGASMPDTLRLLGRDEAIARIDAALSVL